MSGKDMPMRKQSRIAVRRHPERGAYDAETIHAILDEGFLCHVGFVQDDQPFAIPTLYARVGDTLYLHGSPLSRMLRHLEKGVALCVTVTLVDGLVLARSAFHHSINYRSVVILGQGRTVMEPADKEAALRALVDHIVPGRSDDARGPDAQELKATLVIAVPLQEASAKVRTGPPKDAPDDYALDVWAGELPLRLQPLEPIPDTRLASDIPTPEYVRRYRRSFDEDIMA